MIENLSKKLLNCYMEYEVNKTQKNSTQYHKSILPNYVTKRRIVIYNNDKIVFDSNEVDEIPESIQYTIKSYGIPKNITPNNKTPLVYKINTTLSSMFPSEAIENECTRAFQKIAAK